MCNCMTYHMDVTQGMTLSAPASATSQNKCQYKRQHIPGRSFSSSSAKASTLTLAVCMAVLASSREFEPASQSVPKSLSEQSTHRHCLARRHSSQACFLHSWSKASSRQTAGLPAFLPSALMIASPRQQATIVPPGSAEYLCPPSILLKLCTAIHSGFSGFLDQL